jgi:hypothetical protein
MRFTVCCNPSWEKEKERRESDENGLPIPAMLLRQIMTTTVHLEVRMHCSCSRDPITQKHQHQISSPWFLSDSLAFGFIMETRQGGFGMKKRSYRYIEILSC